MLFYIIHPQHLQVLMSLLGFIHYHRVNQQLVFCSFSPLVHPFCSWGRMFSSTKCLYKALLRIPGVNDKMGLSGIRETFRDFFPSPPLYIHGFPTLQNSYESFNESFACLTKCVQISHFPLFPGWLCSHRRRRATVKVVSAQTTRVWCQAIQPLGCVNYYIT